MNMSSGTQATKISQETSQTAAVPAAPGKTGPENVQLLIRILPEVLVIPPMKVGECSTAIGKLADWGNENGIYVITDKSQCPPPGQIQMATKQYAFCASRTPQPPPQDLLDKIQTCRQK
jgi:hypothetical protein